MTVILLLNHLIKTRVFLKKTGHPVDTLCQLCPFLIFPGCSPSSQPWQSLIPWFSFFPREASCIATTVKRISLDVPCPKVQLQALACDCWNSLVGFRIFYDESLMKADAFPWKFSNFNQLVFSNKEHFVRNIPLQFSCLLPQLGL